MANQNVNFEILENSRSLITRAMQIMIVIIGLGLISMISSMLVSESLSGDAENINRAGKLRMLALKVSRTALIEEKNPKSKAATELEKSRQEFEIAFRHIFDGGLTDELNEPNIQLQYHQVSIFWNELKLQKSHHDIEIYDQFVAMIDLLVLQIQQNSEKKISLLRAIQGISLLSVIIVAFVVISRINRGIILPLRRLIVVAEAAGKGDFNIRSEYDEQNELGLLSQTINKMSQELKLTHEEFEHRVEEKTSALERAHEQERIAENRLVIIEERAVIARELHDSLAQSLSYLKIQVALLSKKLDKNLSRQAVDQTVEDIRLGLNRAYFQLRELLTTFRLKLEDPSLESALSGTVVEFSTQSGHKIELDFDLKNKSLTANQEIHILQIVREALSNVSRHAKANTATVTVKYQDATFVVSIIDDGIGMSIENQQEGHFGLGIMKDRAASLNATMEIDSLVGKGTKVSVVFAD